MSQSKRFEIKWDDLTKDAQQRLLKFAEAKNPDEMSWNILPVADVILTDADDLFPTKE